MINYLKNILKVLFWPLLFMLGELCLALGIKKIYNGPYDLILLVILTMIVFIPIFTSQMRKYHVCLKITKDLKDIPMMAISLALSLNLLIIIINKLIGIENIVNEESILMAFLSGIIGPILEEFLFRGIVFEKLKCFNSVKKSLVLSVIIFSIFHNTLVQMVYALFIGYIITKLYIKTNNLLVAIVFHICSNFVIALMFQFIIVLPNYLLFSLTVFFGLQFYYLYKRFMI